MPFDPITQSQGDLVRVLEAFLEKARSGDITSFFWVAERTDGEYEHGFGPCENLYAMAGVTLFTMMRRLGFAIEPKNEEALSDDK